MKDKIISYGLKGYENAKEVLFSSRKKYFLNEKFTEVFFLYLGYGLSFASTSIELMMLFTGGYILTEFYVRDKGLAEIQRQNLKQNIDESGF